MKIWTTLTGADDVAVHLTEDAAVDHLVAFLSGCDDTREVTRDNWRTALAEINAEMDEAGEAHYSAALAEHPLPTPRIVVEQNADGVHEIHTDSPLLDGAEAVTIRADFDAGDYDASDVMEFAFGGGAPAEFVGSRQAVRLSDADVQAAHEAIDAKEWGSARRP